ncbi:hypothetical protein [Mycobacterium sp. E2479]|uniref:hypothetical protein n=1 Tax=Mycobacterium sp. E2479 TaxID=1834134 RepID=UPI0007FFA370|nr:hypothetical protein [Mycobacterium sp. E2479]OBH54326.1 hypothetical protein A5686_08235 [Mycobacterium sp. E2479]
MKAAWKIPASMLKNLRGMIIDRDAAWRANPEMAPAIEAAIRKGIESIDEPTFNRVYFDLRFSGFPGSYETRGFDEKQMEEAWQKYLVKHGYAQLNT